MAEITISVERFEQLVAAERETQIIKNVLAEKLKHYGRIDHSEICTLCFVFGVEAEEE